MRAEEFANSLQTDAKLGVIDETVVDLVLGGKHRLSWLANRSAGAEGTWRLTNIEGEVPKDLSGVLYRIAPGQKVNHGVQLMDFFDGDAFVSAYTFREGGVTLRARFVGLPERHEEIAAGKMLHNEFGTLAPRHRIWPKLGTHWKNQPSVNVIEWDGRLLGLSEGGHPTAIDSRDLSFQSRWDFHGTLPWTCAFTAHPKFDPAAGVGYAYGYTLLPWSSLCVFRMELDGTLTLLYKLPQKKYFMVHDMALTANYLVFVIPPVKLNSMRAFFLRETLAENLRYYESEKTKILILNRSGIGDPVCIEIDPNMVFHHGNAYEQNGNVILDSLMYPDGTILDLVRLWSMEPPPKAAVTHLTRIEIDPARRRIVSRTVFDENIELPRFDTRLTGKPARYLYTTRGSYSNPGDPYGAEMIRIDLTSGRASAYTGPAKDEAFGEPVFVPRERSVAEGEGWILMLGYSGSRDETFLEIVDAGSMQRQARVWTGTHLPLGFHGNFSPAAEGP